MPDARLQKCRALYQEPPVRLSGGYSFHVTACDVCGCAVYSQGYGNVMIRPRHSGCAQSQELPESRSPDGERADVDGDPSPGLAVQTCAGPRTPYLAGAGSEPADSQSRLLYQDAPSQEVLERMVWCVHCREVTPHDGLGCRVCRRMASPLEPDAETPWGV